MARFSERYGYRPEKVIQRESMDGELTNRLWNAIVWWFCSTVGETEYIVDSLYGELLYDLWTDEWKLPIDELSEYSHVIVSAIRERFFKSQWHEALDLLEFLAEHLPEDKTKDLIGYCNRVFEEEKAAYKFVGLAIVEITSDSEVKAIEQGLRDADRFVTVRTHLTKALDLYGKRPKADYANSIKESISAVEALACLIADEPKATLGKVLGVIEKQGNVDIHAALKRAFGILYGYTSDEGGVRHKMLEEGKVGQAEALYMLVACSAFVSYLISKASDAGITLAKQGA